MDTKLTEDKRAQLDQIVQKMVANKESDANIRFVVDDFKQKYTQPAVVEKKESKILDKTAKVLTTVFGGKQIGEAIGTQAAKLMVKPEELQFVEPGPTPLQVAGDVAATGLSVAGLKGVGTAGAFLPRVLKMAGLGAGISGATAVAEGGDVEDVAKSATVGGVIGGAIPFAGAGLRAVGKQIENLPARFVNSALSRNKAQVLQDISKDKVDDLAKYVIAKKPIGTATKLLSDSQNSITELNTKVNNALTSTIRKGGQKITIGRDNLLDDVVKLPEATGALLKRTDVKNIITRLAPQTKQLLSKSSLTLDETNKLRQLLDRTLGDRAFLGGQLSNDKVILKSFANSLRETVKNKAPEGTRALFKELSNEIQFRDGLLNKIAQRQGNQVLSFGDFIGGGLGGVFGGGIPGAIAGVGTRRAIESVPFKLGSAKLINSLTKLAPTIEDLAPAQQTAILEFFADVFSPEEKQISREGGQE